MLESKLIIIFKTLNSKEINKFEAYVQSPFFNKSEKVVQLFDIIKASYPHFKKEQLDKQVVIQKLYGDKPNTEASLRALMSQLTKLLEDFIAQLYFTSDKKAYERTLLLALKDRLLKGLFEKRFNKAVKDLEKKTSQDIDYFYQDLSLSEIYTQHIISSDNRAFKNGLKELMEKIDTFYVAMKLKYASTLLNLQKVLNERSELYFFEEILQFLENSPIGNVAFIQLYHQACLLLKEPKNEQHYHKLKALLEDHSSKVHPREVRGLYVLLANYCTQKARMEAEKYTYELFELYKIMLQKKVLHITQNYISPHVYKNIVTVSLRVKEYDWVKTFIEDHKTQVLPQHQEDVYNYALANLSFSLEKYVDTKMYLQKMNLIDPFYFLGHKVTLIKTHYELEEKDTLHSTIESLRVYLSRDTTLSEANRQARQNFINLLKKIIRIKAGGKKSLDVLRQEIKTAITGERLWLLEKVDELKKNKPTTS